jgi:hypothetical protein
MIEAVSKSILAELKKSDPDRYFYRQSYDLRTTIVGQFDLRLVAVRGIEALGLYRDSAGLADVYVNEVKTLEDF